MTDEEFAELEARYKAAKAERRRQRKLEWLRAHRRLPEDKAKRRAYYLANREKFCARSKARYAKLRAAYMASKP